MNLKKIKISKKVLEYLFSGLGTALIIYVLTLFINEKDAEPESNINFEEGTTINDGNFAGRDIVIEKSSNKELIKILEYRAQKINDDLESYYYYTEVESYLKKFNKLHPKVIKALEDNDMVLAHELIKEIHDISYELELSEQIEFDNIVHPNMQYSLSRTPNLLVGSLIHEYVYGSFKKEKHIDLNNLIVRPITPIRPDEFKFFDTVKKYGNTKLAYDINDANRFNYDYDNPSKIARILIAREKEITEELNNHYKHVNLEDVKAEFSYLHWALVTALCHSQYLQAHERLGDLLMFSAEVENNEIKEMDQVQNMNTKEYYQHIRGKIANKYLLNQWQKVSEIKILDDRGEVRGKNVFDSILSYERGRYLVSKDANIYTYN